MLNRLTPIFKIDQSERPLGTTASRQKKTKFAVPVLRRVSRRKRAMDDEITSLVRLAVSDIALTSEVRFCTCKGACSRKDGKKRKGCPCKTAGSHCTSVCKCGSLKMACKNKSEDPGQGTSDESNGTRPSELEECSRENEEVKRFIIELEEEKVRQLAMRVYCRGTGSMEYIQSQLIATDQSEGQALNFYGSPIRLSGGSQALSAEGSSTDDLDEQPPQLQSTPVRPASVPHNAPLPPPPIPAPPPVAVPEWCRCGHCRQMPRQIERVCCKNKDCVAQTARFRKLCLDEDVLKLSILDRADVRNDRYDNTSRQFRKAAYRHFILEKHGYLGRRVRRVVPACCVCKVRDAYPSITGVYMGFKEA